MLRPASFYRYSLVPIT